MRVIINILGIAVILLAMFLISKDRKSVRKSIVIKAVAVQFVIAFLLVKFPLGRVVVSKVSDVVTRVLDYGKMEYLLCLEALDLQEHQQDLFLRYSTWKYSFPFFSCGSIILSWNFRIYS